jgi:hypothetical protein
LPNRYIGENVRLVLDIIEYTEKYNLPGTLFFIDFEKAYDKLEWDFVQKSLGFWLWWRFEKMGQFILYRNK